MLTRKNDSLTYRVLIGNAFQSFLVQITVPGVFRRAESEYGIYHEVAVEGAINRADDVKMFGFLIGRAHV